MDITDLVLIGRNEGARLVQALQAAQGQASQIIYVDSGSDDNSVQAARDMGATVVELDTSQPFSAARGRNAGFAASRRAVDPAEFVQFIDGDCRLEPGWTNKARIHLQSNPDLGLVTGWRSEIAPEISVYNRICDHEWHRPAGPIRACGGDMMVRAEAFVAVGGFDSGVIAAEDDDFCLRLAKAGWKLERLPHKMTWHDAAITSFAQWWTRAVRAGHGFAQVGNLHPEHFRAERRRVLVFGLLLPVLFVIGIVIFAPLAWAVLAGYVASYLRGYLGLRRDGLSRSEAGHQAVFLTLSKIPNLIGMARYHVRRLRKRAPRIIEYQ
ncbi:MAG: glycosyltransferase family 2 protein [Pseudomonadota bacterium]